MRAHGSYKNRVLHTLVADGSIWAQRSLLVIGSLVLGQDGAGNVQAGDHVALGQLKAQALGVVVDILDLGQLEGEEALVAALEGRLGRNDGLDLGRGAAKVPVSAAA